MAKKDEAEATESKPGFNVSGFFDETKEELDKVVWPSRQQLISLWQWSSWSFFQLH
jgi:preprotein translocase subunit SecE